MKEGFVICLKIINQPPMATRRNILKQTAFIPFAFSSLDFSGRSQQDDNLNFVGPKSGYTPQIGTLVSMMNWMRATILSPVQGMSQKDLDFLLDEKSNTVGAMLWHLAATEKFYQENTFNGMAWNQWQRNEDEEWLTAMNLGNKARKRIKGNNLEFYLEKLEQVREESLSELKKRDDEWLLKLDESWGWGPTNNYCKWFHVVEHESNHNGQIKYIRGRFPS